MRIWELLRQSRSWRNPGVWGLFALLVGIVAFDVAFPSVLLLPLLLIPVVIGALLCTPAVTGVLGAVAGVIALVAYLLNDQLVRQVDLVWIAVFCTTAVVSVLVAARRVRLAAARAGAETTGGVSEARYRLLAENATDVVSQSDLDGLLVWVSPSAEEVLGIPARDLVRRGIGDFVHSEDQQVVVEAVSRAEGGAFVDFEVRLRVASGAYRWFALRTHPILDESGGTIGYTAGWRDVDGERRSRDALAASERQYRLLAQNAMDLVFSLDTKAIIQWVSPSATALLGYDPDDLVGRFGAVLLHPDDLPILLESADRAREGTPTSCRVRMLTKEGAECWVDATPRGLYDEDHILVGGVIGVRDIRDEVVVRQALEHEVAFDGLTGLAKRPLALERIQEILDTRQAQGWALLCIGVDRMTAVNQAFSFAAGDEVLRTVAARLVEACGAPDRVARVAGDDFVVLLRDIVTPADAGNAAVRMLAAVRGEVAIMDGRFEVTACAGIAMSDGLDAHDLLRDAMAAMRHASATGTDRWEFSGGDVGAETRHTLAVQVGLRDALPAGGIQAWFMPIVGLADGRVRGHEALVRWARDDGTIVGPVDFLGIAEHSDLILAIDRSMIRSALAELVGRDGDSHMSVNIAAATLAAGVTEQVVRDELERTGIAPARLHLEVTETALLHVNAAIQKEMSALADLGVSWWVDDFGTGFSSISHLRDLPIAGLKLDQSFTADLTEADDHVARLTRGLAGLADGLHLATVAEGVETELQARILAAQGWEMGQGWLFGRPGPRLNGSTAGVDA